MIRTEAELKELEANWHERLVGHSLVIEADIEPTFAIDALNALSESVSQAHGRSRLRIFEQYPAILAAGLCAIASTQYEAGSFWPNVPQGLVADTNRQREVGNAFQIALDRMELSRFTTPHRYVGEILMHAGVPVSSIKGLTSTIRQWDDGYTSGDAAGFVRWAASMSQAVAVTRGFDVPTHRFLTEGGEIAEDFIERVLGAIDADGATSDLPPAIAEAISSALEGTTIPSRVSRRRTLDSAPSLTYDPHSGIRVRLPPLEAEIEAAITWAVLAGGEVQRLPVEPPWPGEPVEPKWIGVQAPQQSVSVALYPGNQHWELPLVDSKDPLLIFDGNSGTLIPDRVSLPKSSIWLALPAGHENPESLLEVSGELVVTEHGVTPHGWQGWAFMAIDTSKVKKLRFASVENHRWRYVTTVERPRLSGVSEALPNLSTVEGGAILSSRPQLLLPGPRSGAGRIEWSIVITNEHGEEISRVLHDVTQTRDVDLFTSKGPLLGQYIITARGPLGRGATMKVAVAEQVSIEASTHFRWISERGDGLEPAKIAITGEGLSSAISISLKRDDRVGSATLRRNQEELRVVGEVPYLTVGFAPSTHGKQSLTPLQIDIEALPDTIIQTQVPAGSGKVYASAILGDSVLQTLEGLGSWGSQVRTFDLSALSGTLTTKPSAELRLVVDDRSAPIAFIRPRQLAEAVYVDATGVLSIQAKADVDGLVAHIYPTFARWRGPYTLAIPAGLEQMPLPDEVRREGRAVIVLAVENPWIRSSPPERPDLSNVNAFDTKVGTLAETDDPAERGFRHWLAGIGTCPSSVESLPVALRLYSLLRHEESPEHADRMRTELAEAVRAHRTSLLSAILRSNADLDDLMRLLVEADVVTVPRESWESSDELWSLAPGLAVLADTDKLGGEDEPAFRAYLEKKIGAEGVSILDTGKDPAIATGKFDDSIHTLIKMNETALEEFINAAEIIPKALLDEDSRVTASMQLLSAFNRPAILTIRKFTNKLVELCTEAVVADFGIHAKEPIAAREFPTKGGAGNLPAASLGLALLARATARSKPQSLRLYQYIREGFTKLATEAPRIVHQDLALAELWITRWEDAT